MSALPRAGVPAVTTGHVIRDSSLGLVKETLEPIVSLAAMLFQGHPLRPARVELLRLRNANAVNCVICKAVRYDVAKNDGLTEQKVSSIAAVTGLDALSAEETLLVEFADTYLLHPERLEATLATRLHALPADQLAHMAIAIATFNALSRAAVSLSGMPESFPVTEIAVPAA